MKIDNGGGPHGWRLARARSTFFFQSTLATDSLPKTAVLVMGECVLGEPSFFGTRQNPAVLVAEEAFSCPRGF